MGTPGTDTSGTPEWDLDSQDIVVTSGSNGGETGTVGWDYASGFGRGIVSALNAGL